APVAPPPRDPIASDRQTWGRARTVIYLSKLTQGGKRTERKGEYAPLHLEDLRGERAGYFRSEENFACGIARRHAHSISTRHPIGDLDSGRARDISWHGRVGSFLRVSDWKRRCTHVRV